jgi:hypothetical protein
MASDDLRYSRDQGGAAPAPPLVHRWNPLAICFLLLNLLATVVYFKFRIDRLVEGDYSVFWCVAAGPTRRAERVFGARKARARLTLATDALLFGATGTA